MTDLTATGTATLPEATETGATGSGANPVYTRFHGKTEVEWAWEFHKNCDQLLHQRLASFTAAQSMTLAAFMVLTNARFQPNIPADRLIFIELGRYTIDLFGLLMSIFTWIVTSPMVMRLDYLNKYVLANEIPVYNDYLYKSLDAFTIPGWQLVDRVLKWLGRSPEEREPRRFYRMIIPRILPIVELGLWIILFLLMVFADVFAGAPSASAPPPPSPGYILLGVPVPAQQPPFTGVIPFPLINLMTPAPATSDPLSASPPAPDGNSSGPR